MTGNFKLVLIEERVVNKRGTEEIEQRVNYWINKTDNCINDKDLIWHLEQNVK